MVIAGPYGAAMLADMGARVIKVTQHPNMSRRLAPVGMALINLKNYAGKEAIQINLQSAEGQKILLRLVARADVLSTIFVQASLSGCASTGIPAARSIRELIHLLRRRVRRHRSTPSATGCSSDTRRSPRRGSSPAGRGVSSIALSAHDPG